MAKKDPKGAGEGHPHGRQDRPEDQPASRTAEGTPPKVGEEGGVVEEGTGDFAPDANPEGEKGDKGDTVTTTTRTGEEVEVEVGADGENPVSPQNPPKKAVLGGGDAAANTETAEARNEGTGGDRETAESFEEGPDGKK